MREHANNAAHDGKPPSARPQITLLKAEAFHQGCIQHHLHPSDDLAPFAAVAWTMEWKFGRNQTLTQQVLPNPAVQIVVGSGHAEVFGIVTGPFSTTLEGEGFILGLKFHPCGFYPMIRDSVAALTDRRLPLAEFLPDVNVEALQGWARTRDKDRLLAGLEDGLRALAPRQDQIGVRLEDLIRQMEQDSSMLTVNQAADWFGTSRRTLQRLFQTRVGVSPKWVLKRFRLKEAAARIERGEMENMAELAQRLGYYDQAHLIRDFRAMTGRSPAGWLKS